MRPFVSLLCLVCTTFPVLSAEYLHNAMPDEINQAMSQKRAIHYNNLGESMMLYGQLSVNVVPSSLNDSLTTTFGIHLEEYAQSKAFLDGKVGTGGAINALSIRMRPVLEKWDKETNLLRKRKFEREKVLPQLPIMAKQVVSEFTMPYEYIILDYKRSAGGKLQISYDPLNVNFLHFKSFSERGNGSGHGYPSIQELPDWCEKNSHFSLGVGHQYRVNFDPIESLGKGCEVVFPFDDEDFAIEVIDQLEVARVYRLVLKIDSNIPYMYAKNVTRITETYQVAATAIDATLVGIAILDIDLNPILYKPFGEGTSQKQEIAAQPDALGKTTGSTTLPNDLNLSCRIQDYKSEGFFSVSRFTARHQIGDVNRAQLFNSIAEDETTDENYDVRIGSNDGSKLVVLQKAGKGNVVSTYTFDDGYLYADVKFPDGVLVTKDMTKQGFCTIIERL
jgi:hypothetical protein